jgi:hypothetical protein
MIKERENKRGVQDMGSSSYSNTSSRPCCSDACADVMVLAIATMPHIAMYLRLLRASLSLSLQASYPSSSNLPLLQ